MPHRTTGTRDECRVELRDREDDLKRTDVRAFRDDVGRICLEVDGESVKVVAKNRCEREE